MLMRILIELILGMILARTHAFNLAIPEIR